MIRHLLIAASIAVGLGACTRGADTPVPRRTAYPRPQLIDTLMRDVSCAGVTIPVNARAAIDSPRAGWLNVSYPMYGATIHITVSRAEAAAIDEVRRNRMERLMLNSGALPGRQLEWTNGAGMQVMAVRTPGATTPLQFLATDGTSAVVSAAVFFPGLRPDAPYDSISPILDIIQADITRCLDNMEISSSR